ncbi:MAG TPA: hypothetical protein VFQ07_09265, partial [Candidatus Polarisedimenticolia bacterium]|nr:hypothetical protein [Candidatus Polarisedimenticolia bacterium]
MNAGGRAERRRIPAASLIVFLCVALVGTLGHGEPASRGALRPVAEDPATPRPPFVVTREITVESSIAFDGPAARTTHQLILERPPFGVATLELTADGAFGTAIDRASASAEGVIDAEAADAGTDCRPATGRTVIPVNDLQRITADGVLSVAVRNTATVTSRCAENRHTVRLRYETLAESLQFPPTRAGSSTTVAINLHRLSGGKAPLTLTLSSDRDAFTPLTTQVLLEPDGSQAVAIRFRPATSGPVEGTLAIAAAGGARALVRLSGEALDPALVGVDPGALDVSLPVGGGTTRTVQVSNLSGRALDLEATVEGSAVPGAPAVCASPAVYVLEGISNALARIDLHDGSVTHVGPQIFGASALALEAGDASALVTTFLGEVVRLQIATGTRQVLAQGLLAIQDVALSPDGASLYMLQRDAGAIQRFDVASGTVQPFVGGLSSPSRLDLTPDGATLWVATGSGLAQIDVATAAKTVFPELAGAASPRFDPGSGLVYVRTDSPAAVRAFDPVSRSLTTTGLLGTSEFTRFALASHGRLAFGLDEFEPVLKRMDLQDGQLTPLTTDLESVRDLEVRADADCLGTFLTVAPSTFSLQPNGSAALVAAFSALGARPGTFAAAIRLREAGQTPIVASVAAQLTIASAPHLALEGAPRTVEQVQTARVGTHPGIVTFDLPMGTVTGPGVLAITTEAALHGSIGITLQGTSVGSDVNPQCVRTTRQHDIGASILHAAAQEGSALVRLQL